MLQKETESCERKINIQSILLIEIWKMEWGDHGESMTYTHLRKYDL